MTRWIDPAVVLVLAAISAHWASLAYAPSLIMDRALLALKDRGIAEHAFTSPKRITPQSQAVVRSSPDLFYSLCRYDLNKADAPLKVTMSAWPDYQSLSFFDGDTNNFATFRGEGRAVSIILAKSDHSDLDSDALISPSTRGVILIRRVAPTRELFETAKQAAQGDACQIGTT